MRQSEVIGLQWQDIDWDKGINNVSRQRQRNIKEGGYRMIETTKNGKARKVTAAKGVLKVLEQQRQHQEADRIAAGPAWENTENFVFTDKLGRPVNHPSVYKHYKKIVASIGMKESRFHDLRHSYAINAIQGGDVLDPVRSFGTNLLVLLVLACGIIAFGIRLAVHVNKGTDAGKKYTRIMLPSFVFILFADLFFIIISVLQGGIFRGWFSGFKPDAECGIMAESGK